jgi:hypothetical protein
VAGLRWIGRRAREGQKAIGTANITGKSVSFDTDLNFGKSVEKATNFHELPYSRRSMARAPIYAPYA